MIRTIKLTTLLFLGLQFVAPSTDAAVRITEFMSEGQGDLEQGNGGRRQREFFELTNLGNVAVDVSTWSHNDNNVNDPHNWGPVIGSIAAGESIVFTQMTEAAFRTHWDLPNSVRIYSYLQASNLGNADTINIYNSFTQIGDNLVDSLAYTADFRGSGVSRNRPADGATGQFLNSAWLISSVGDIYQSRMAPTAVSFDPPFNNPANYIDVANPGVYGNVPEPATIALAVGMLLAGVFRRKW